MSSPPLAAARPRSTHLDDVVEAFLADATGDQVGSGNDTARVRVTVELLDDDEASE